MLGRIVEASPIGFAAVDARGIVACANAAFCRMFDFADADAAAGSVLVERLRPRSLPPSAELLAALEAPEEAIVAIRPGRGLEELTLHITAAGTGPRMLVACRNPAADDSEPASKHLSNLDPLTGLGNRRMLDDS